MPRLERALKKNVADYFRIELQTFRVEEMEVDEFFEVKKAYHEEYKNTMRLTRVKKLRISLKLTLYC